MKPRLHNALQQMRRHHEQTMAISSSALQQSAREQCRPMTGSRMVLYAHAARKLHISGIVHPTAAGEIKMNNNITAL